jgi:hypothetical protein
LNVVEAAHMLRWLSNVDARVIYTEEAVEMWAHALAPFAADEVKQAILDHYRTNESVAATHAGVRKRALAVRDTRAAQQRAIEPPARVYHESDYRRKIRETPEFMALFEQGRREGNAERAYATVLRETGDRGQAFAARDRILRGEAEAA